MVPRQRSIAAAVVVLALTLRASAAAAQPVFTMSVALGSPTAFTVDVRYHDPGELFERLKGARLIPLWATVRNVSPGTVTLDYRDIRLGLGDPSRTPLSPLDAQTTADEFRKAAGLGTLLGALAGGAGKSGGNWGANPFSRRLAGGALKPGQSRSGFLFYLRPADLVFNGVMTLAAAQHPPELLTTKAVAVTRGAGIAEYVRQQINEVGRIASRIVYGEPPFGRSYAVLFGISKYTYQSELALVERDLANMAQFLKDQGFDEVIAVRNSDVTAGTLRNIQGHLHTRLQPQDRLLVYYAGHGLRSATGRTASLVLADSRPDRPTSRSEIPMSEFMGWMRDLAVKHLLVLLDACYSGAAIGGVARGVGDTLDKTNQQLLYKLSSEGGRYVITAGDEDQLANEDRDWDGGLFTYAVLHSLRAKESARADSRIVTTHELFSRVKRVMLDEIARHRLTDQTPLMQDLGSAGQASKGEFVFVN